MRWKNTNKHPKRLNCPCRILAVNKENIAEMFTVDYPTDIDRKTPICMADIYPWKKFIKEYKIVKWEYEDKIKDILIKKLKLDYIHLD